MLVFISHSTTNDSIATRIAHYLNQHGVSAWVDHMNIRIGDDWNTTIQSFLNNCDAGLLILSKASATSAECRNEWRTILDLKKPLYVVSVEKIPVEIFPYRLRTIQYADLTEQFEVVLEELVNAIKDRRGIHSNQGFTGRISLNANDYIAPQRFDVQGSRLLDLQTLRRAWVRAWHSAKLDATYYDRFGYNFYQNHLEANLIVLRERLQSRKFRLDPFYAITIPKGKKQRQLYYACAETSLVLQALTDTIGEALESKISAVAFGHRLSLDSVDTKNVFIKWQDQYGKFQDAILGYAASEPESWFHKTDIQEFYPNVNKEILLRRILPDIKDPHAAWLLEQFFSCQALHEDGTLKDIPGLPAGIPISHLLANVYLAEVDQVMSVDADAYFRYVDDVIFFARDEYAVNELQAKYEVLLASTVYVKPNSDKLVTEASANTHVLTSVLQEISDLWRVSWAESIPHQQKQEVARTFYDIFFLNEGIEDPKAITKHVGSALHKMYQWGYPEEELDGITLDVLRAAPLRPNQVRTLMSYLIERNIQKPSAEFLQFVQEAPNYVKIAFLQMLEGFDEDEIVPQLLQVVVALLQSDSLLVRGEATLTLAHITPKNVDLNISLEDILGAISSPYVRERALLLAIALGKVEDYIEIYLKSEEPRLVKVALSLIEQEFSKT